MITNQKSVRTLAKLEPKSPLRLRGCKERRNLAGNFEICCHGEIRKRETDGEPHGGDILPQKAWQRQGCALRGVCRAA